MSVQVIEQGEPAPPIVERDGKSPQDLQREALQAAVLDALARGASYQKAADAAGVTRRTIYNWREADEQFAVDVDNAIQSGVDLLEDEAHRRAMGWEEDVFNKDGERVGSRLQYSDRLMEFMLSGRRPEKFRAPKGTIVNVDARNQTLNTLAPEALELLQRIADASGGQYERGKGEDK